MGVKYVKDVACATLATLANMENLKSRICNLASLVPSPSAEEIAGIVDKYSPKAEIKFKPDPTITRTIDSWPRDVDTKRAQNQLGWKPKYGHLNDLVGGFISDVEQHPDVYAI